MNRLIDLIRDNPQQVSALVAMCAVLLSFTSIILTVTALWLQRRHYFKSLTPIADIYFCDSENLIQITLKNAGVGPLIIERFRVSRGEEKATGNISELLPGDYFECTTHLDGVCVSPQEEIPVVELKGEVTDREFVESRKALRAALSGLHLTISYKDIYDRRMNDEDRDLKNWFGPNPDEEVCAPDGISSKSAVVSETDMTLVG